MSMAAAPPTGHLCSLLVEHATHIAMERAASRVYGVALRLRDLYKDEALAVGVQTPPSG